MLFEMKLLIKLALMTTFLMILGMTPQKIYAAAPICLICDENLDNPSETSPEYFANYCQECLLTYFKVNIENGGSNFPNPNEPKENFLIEHIISFLTNLEQTKLVNELNKLIKNSENLKNQTDGFHVACSHCAGLFNNRSRAPYWWPEEGTPCKTCSTPFKRPIYKKGWFSSKARYCTYCRLITMKTGGCDHMNCGLCKKPYSWARAQRARKFFP